MVIGIGILFGGGFTLGFAAFNNFNLMLISASTLIICIVILFFSPLHKTEGAQQKVRKIIESFIAIIIIGIILVGINTIW